VFIIHIDKSQADIFGNLCLALIQWSLAMSDNMNGQYSMKAFGVLAYIPNLSAGKGTNKRKIVVP
jgi:hypothetical protein